MAITSLFLNTVLSQKQYKCHEDLYNDVNNDILFVHNLGNQASKQTAAPVSSVFVYISQTSHFRERRSNFLVTQKLKTMHKSIILNIKQHSSKVSMISCFVVRLSVFININFIKE